MLRQGDVAVDEDGRDEHVGQVVDHQVEHRAVEMRQHFLDFVLARQGAVEAVHQQGQAEPEQAGLGFVVDQREQGQQGQDHATGGDGVDAPGLGFVDGSHR